jgi:hypothetical protein
MCLRAAEDQDFTAIPLAYSDRCFSVFVQRGPRLLFSLS